jgi:Tfp pilus assembly protein PilX
MTGRRKRGTAQPANRLGSQSGIALLLALVIIVILTAFALSLVLTAQSETQMGNTIAARSQAYYAALAGLEEARARLNPLVPQPELPVTAPQQINQVVYLVNSTPQDPVDPTNSSSPYYDYEYRQEFPGVTPQVSAVASDQRPGTSYVIPYKWVRITLETEYAAKTDVNQDGFLDQTTPIYWDGANQYLGTSPPCTYPPCVSPVYMLTALAVEPSGIKKMVQAEVVGTPPSTLTPAAAAGTAGSATLTGLTARRHRSANLTLNGMDICGAQNVPGIAAGSTPPPSGLINIQGSPPEPPVVPFPFGEAAITNIIQSVLPLAVPIVNADPAHVASVGGSLAGTNVALGQPPGPSSPGQPVVVYANQSLAISGPASTGYGILLVNGNLSITDGFHYEGLIVSNGTVTITTSPAGDIRILGSLTSSGNLSISSSASPYTFVRITYDSCAVPNAAVNSFQSLPLRVRSFKELSFSARIPT